MIRYAYYAMSNPLVAGRQTPDFVRHLRYSAFLVLYPVGFLSEFVILYKAFAAASGIFNLILIGLMVVYWPGTLSCLPVCRSSDVSLDFSHSRSPFGSYSCCIHV